MFHDVVVRYNERVVQDGRSTRRTWDVQKFYSLKDAEDFCESNNIEVEDVFSIGKEIPMVDTRAICDGMQRYF